MKIIGLLGTSALEGSGFVDSLIAALRLEGHTVSTIKRAPEHFDLDRPGKVSWARREAGSHEVMLVGGSRFVLMQEFRDRTLPSLDALVARLEPVDVVLAEGFRDAGVPTIEVLVTGSGRTARWPHDPHVVALVSDEPVAAPLPRFATADAAGVADFIVSHSMLPRE